MIQNKKGEIGQILLYVIMLVIFVLLLSFGYTTIKDLNKEKDRGTTEVFESEISKISESMKNEYGGFTEKKIEIGADVTRLCVIDYKYHKDSILDSEHIDEFPFIKDNLELNISDNVYFYSDNGFLRSGKVEGICVPKHPYFYCAKTEDRYINMGFEGQGDCSALTMRFDPFEVNVNNIRNPEKYGNQTIAIYPKESDLITERENILRVLTLFIYKNSNEENDVIFNPIIFFDNSDDKLALYEVNFLKNKYHLKSNDLIYYQSKPAEMNDVGGVPVNELLVDDILNYLSYWENYHDIVVINKNDPNYLIGALFASNMNAPLIIYAHNTNYADILGSKNIYLIDEERFTADEIDYISTMGNITSLDGESLKLGLYFSELTGMFRNSIQYLSSEVTAII